MNCGSTTRIATCQVDAPSVCALMSCSRGIAATSSERSRIRVGVTPIMISITFDNSPRPNTMNRIGSTAIGGIIDSTATKVPNPAPATGKRPIARPNTKPVSAAIPSPSAKRCRLAAVSAHSTYSPDRRSGSAASRFDVATISETGGNSLSSGLAARRSADPIT